MITIHQEAKTLSKLAEKLAWLVLLEMYVNENNLKQSYN